MAFQTMTASRFKSLTRPEAIKQLSERISNNLAVTGRVLNYCQKRGWNYRLSSSLFPLLTYGPLNLDLQPHFDSTVGTLVVSNVRVSIHPDQFNVLASDNPVVVDKTIAELDFQAWVLSRFSQPTSAYESPMNIHMNCSKGDPKDVAKRFMAGRDRLRRQASACLVLENEDKGMWTVENLYKYIYKECKVPITFDYLHHKCNPGSLSEEEAFHLCASTWDFHGLKPHFHYSQSLPGDKNPRKHADVPTLRPSTYNTDIDLDMEFKGKDDAIDRIEAMDKEFADANLRLQVLEV